MKTKAMSTLFGVLVLATLACAQDAAAPALQGSVIDAVGLPGQTWTSIGNLSPIERGNNYVQSYVEQDAALFATNSGSITLTPYVSLGMVLDTKGYDWNNKVEPRIGMKLNKVFRNGVVSIGSAYSYEDRFNSLQSSGLVLYAQDWFGWQPVAEKAKRFPGSTWAIVGTLSPVEHGNIITQGFVSQGVVAKRFSKMALVPFGQLTLSRDTQGFDWENKALYGSGLKIVIPRDEVYTEIGTVYLHERRFQSGQSAGGLTVFANFSFSWNLLNRKAGR